MLNVNVKVNGVERTKGEIMAVKRLITEAGGIQDRIAGDLKRLDELKKSIKQFETSMITDPGASVVLVSGTHVATLSAEAARHEITPEVNRTLFGMIGLDQFMEVATFKIPDMEKIVGKHQFLTICPKEFNGTGRRFTLKAKT